jgi:hypothetical protein
MMSSVKSLKALTTQRSDWKPRRYRRAPGVAVEAPLHDADRVEDFIRVDIR